MSRYLLAITIGPVQGFIAAARRTRDFWMGSTILSECAKAIARWVTEADSQQPKFEHLIFPGVDTVQGTMQLQPWDFDDEGNMPEHEFNVSNVLLLDVETDDPLQFAAVAKQQLVNRWQDIVNRTLTREREDNEGKKGVVRRDLDEATLQIQLDRPGDFFEFYAAWVPFGGADYECVRGKLMRLLGARKSCRNFEAWDGRALKPKSSLDAARESVLKPPEDRSLSLHIRDTEQLDLVGVVKRLDFGNDAIRFPSVSRFAADPWIRGLLQASGDAGAAAMEEISNVCERLRQYRLLRRRYDSPGKPQQDDLVKHSWWNAFPYEGTPLFVSRHEELLREHPHFRSEAERHRRPQAYDRWKATEAKIRPELARIAKSLGRLKDNYGEPKPYFAILAADGDAMGETLATLARRNDPSVHRAFSLAQTQFADAARKLVNSPWLPDSQRGPNSMHGAMVFAGADDILAFAPLDQCLALARDLHDLFARSLRASLIAAGKHDAVGFLEGEGAFPTLRVGIAIGHFMEPLEDLFEYANAANRRAKWPSADEQGRKQAKGNGLAIAIHSRGGAPFTVRDNWRDGEQKEKSIDHRILLWADMHRRRQIPSKAAYDLREVSREYDAKWADGGQLTKAIRQDAFRVFGRKRVETQAEAAERQQRLHSLIGKVQNAADLLALSQELLVGQWIAEALDQARAPLLGTAQPEAHTA